MVRFLSIGLGCCLSFSVAASTAWELLQPGLSYARLVVDHGFTRGTIHAFKIDPKRFELQFAYAEDYPGLYASSKNLVRAKQGVLGVNGGFFSPKMQPLGLRISNGLLHTPLRQVRWWAVFAMRGDQPYLYAPGTYSYNKDMRFAVEAGPRLVAHHRIPTLRGGLANRTALGITQDQQLIVLATQYSPMTTMQLASMMKAPESKGGLNCVEALNLDGGSSTQLYAEVDDFKLLVPSFVPVADVVVVVPRAKSSV